MFGRCLSVLVVACGVVVFSVGVAGAVVPGPGWEITGRSAPTVMQPGGEGLVYLDVYNTGALPSAGPATVTDVLPVGLVAKASASVSPGYGVQLCPGSGRVVTCTVGMVAPSFEPAMLAIPVSVEPGASGDPSSGDRATVVGGGAVSTASTVIPVRFGSGDAGLGFSNFDAWFTNADGTADTQTGSHPYEATVVLAFNTTGLGSGKELPADGEVAAIDVNLPPGVVGNPNAVPQCTRSQLIDETCPPGSWIGEDLLDFSAGGSFLQFQVFNMVPPAGMPAQFAFNLGGIFTGLDAHLRSGGDSGITEHVNVAERTIVYNSITFWGYPAEHNGSGLPPAPLFTLPTSCGAPAKFSVETLGSWQDPHATAPTVGFEYHGNDGVPAGFTGCERLTGFEPAVSSLTPDTSFADSAAGLEARVRIPQGLSPEGLATSGLRGVTVALPEGVSVNPGQASGLGACSQEEAGVGSNSLADEGPPACPASSEIGTDEIETPILKDRLKGDIYLLQSSPPELQILVAASGDGVNIKAVGTVDLDTSIGRLTTTFDGTQGFPGLPDAPVSEFDLAFDGGPQAAIVTPATCGSYTSSAAFEPQASPFLQDVSSQASFGITSGPGGSGIGACTGPLPFTPSLTAGSTTELAGGFTGLSVLLSRGDGQQRVSSMRIEAPPGLLGMIGSVPLCPEPQASQGACSSGSQIGHTVVGAGPGGYPLYLPQPGQPQAPVYLTGPYDGAPYGLSVVVPIVAGPFNLGTEVVRAKVEVDPHTAQVIVVTDQLPQIIKGVPVDLRTVSVLIDKQGFLFNPTSCNPSGFTGAVTSVQGAVANVSSRFQVGACAALGFKPSFSVSTQGKTSKTKGASLTVKVAYPLGGGGKANLAKVDVQLPKQLPARLTTLQKACTAAQFESNPAGCPSASDVGSAVARTPALSTPLTGPAYLVSHGGSGFPDLEVVLQGGGITLVVDGETQIKKGITSSLFETVPDAPISSFTLTLPEGQYSALGTNIPAKAKGSLCGQSLTMPTSLVAQDGAVLKQTTKIAVTGCPKAKKKPKTKKKTKHDKGAKHTKSKAKK